MIEFCKYPIIYLGVKNKPVSKPTLQMTLPAPGIGRFPVSFSLSADYDPVPPLYREPALFSFSHAFPAFTIESIIVPCALSTTHMDITFCIPVGFRQENQSHCFQLIIHDFLTGCGSLSFYKIVTINNPRQLILLRALDMITFPAYFYISAIPGFCRRPNPPLLYELHQ